MNSILRSRFVVLLVVSLVVLAACRGEEEAAEEPTASEPEGSTEEPTTNVDIQTGIGTTDEPCDDAVNPDNGCIYLGIISDLTGPFAPITAASTDAQQAFWQRVNENGGIAGFDIDATTYVGDNQYNPQLHFEVFQEMRNEVLALAQSAGSSQTMSIIDQLRDEDIVAGAMTFSSLWAFEDIVVEAGANYCVEAMNGTEWAIGQFDVDSVMSVHFPGDMGEDGAAGARIVAEAYGFDFSAVETPPGTDEQEGAISAILSVEPDVVFVATAPSEMATIVAETVSRGFEGQFVGSNPSWNVGLLDSAAAEILQERYHVSAPWGPWGTETDGHRALEEALPDATPNDGYLLGWVMQYPILAALERAAAEGDLTRAGLREAVSLLEEVDFEGVLPPESGRFVGEPDEIVFRESVVLEVAPDEPTGVRIREDFFVEGTANEHVFSEACFDRT